MPIPDNINGRFDLIVGALNNVEKESIQLGQRLGNFAAMPAYAQMMINLRQTMHWLDDLHQTLGQVEQQHPGALSGLVVPTGTPPIDLEG